MLFCHVSYCTIPFPFCKRPFLNFPKTLQTEFASNCCRVYATDSSPPWWRLKSFDAFLGFGYCKPTALTGIDPTGQGLRLAFCVCSLSDSIEMGVAIDVVKEL